MKKLEQLYEGKAKKVYMTEDPNVVIVDPTTNKDGRVTYGQNPYVSLSEAEEKDLTTFELDKRGLSSVEDIRNTCKQLNETIKEKENMTKALIIMLNLIENNPLIINKLIIAPLDV